MHELHVIYQKLFAYYGPRHWWPADGPFEMAVGAILTQNTNWQNVEKAIANLKKADALDVVRMLRLTQSQLESLIHPSGFFRQKAARLLNFCHHLETHHQGSLVKMLAGPLEAVREELLCLKGIGPETADSILLYGGAHPSFVVDAYTLRIFTRLGVLEGSEKYDEIRTLFMHNLPADASLYNEYHALIVAHAKAYCRKRPLCEGCPLSTGCRYRLQHEDATPPANKM